MDVALLGLEELAQRLVWSAALLHDLRHPVHLVILESADIVLEDLLESLQNDVG